MARSHSLVLPGVTHATRLVTAAVLLTTAPWLGACDTSGPLDPGDAARTTVSSAEVADLSGAGFFVGNLLQPGTTNGVLRFDGTGAFIDRMVPQQPGVLPGCCFTFGPDQHLYVAAIPRSSVRRYHGVTGEFIDEFVPPGHGGLFRPLVIVFHSDGLMYVGDIGTQSIRRFDATTGAFVDEFIRMLPQGATPIDPQHFVFGPDGHVYVASQGTSRVLRYDGATGAFIDEFVPVGPDGIVAPSGLTFGPDGHLYASSTATSEVRRYDVASGSLIDVFVPPGSGGLALPVGTIFGPDGNLYVASVLSANVLRYDGRTGAFMDVFIPAGRGGLAGPRMIEWKAKLLVCHVPPGKPAPRRTLTIDYMSGFDHVAHGDELGQCGI